MIDPASIKEKLAALRAKDKTFKLFGASGHRYVLNPPLGEKAVAAFERRWHVALPVDYRRFMIEVGNGGAGPYYGLFKLGEVDDGFGHRAWGRAKRGGLVGDPSKPFVHTKAWGLPARIRAKMPDTRGMTPEAEDAAWQTWDALLAEHLWAPALMNGAIPICHLGCALRQWLVVTGPRAGEVWNDDRADERDVAPLVLRGKRVTFARWYEGWLDAALRKRFAR